MNKVYHKTLILLLITVLYGCSLPKAELDFNNLDTIDQAIQEAKKKEKYLVLILEDRSCDLCQLYKKSILQLNNLEKAYFPSDVIFKSIDVKSEDNLWLNQLLREYSFPLTIILNPESQLKGLIMGAREEVLTEAFTKVYRGENYYNSIETLFLNLQENNNNLSGTEKITFLNSIFQPYLNYRATGKLTQQEQEIILQTIESKTYFFNRYLLTKAAQSENKTEEAKSIAESILTDSQSELDAILYHKLKIELRYLTNIQFNEFDGPLLTTAQTEIDFGNAKIGSVKTIKIPVKNTGKEPLQINNVRVSCSCMNIQWPKIPIQPGKTDSIFVQYKLEMEGIFRQNLFVFSNSPNEPLRINIKGNAIVE